MLVAFRAIWPGITVQLHEETHDGDLLHRLANGTLDISFVQLSQPTPGLDVVELLRDDYVALVPPGHRFAARASVTLRDFAGEELVSGSEHDSYTSVSERALRAAGVDVTVVFRTDENTALQRLVGAGLGVAIAPALTVEPSLADGAVVVPLQGEMFRVIGLAWSGERTPSTAVLAFRDVAITTIASLRKAPERYESADRT